MYRVGVVVVVGVGDPPGRICICPPPCAYSFISSSHTNLSCSYTPSMAWWANRTIDWWMDWIGLDWIGAVVRGILPVHGRSGSEAEQQVTRIMI